MRDPNRIKEILTVIEEIWTKAPDLRLMQLLLNAIKARQLSDSGMYITTIDHYNTEDGVVLEKLKEKYKELLKGESDA